jgi:thimet oligopeptidase
VLPLSAVVGNGPSAAKGERPLFTHQGVYELLHELGHLVDAMLSAAPYSSLSGVFTRPDFVEAPSQLMEEWAWDPATLRRLSRHVRTGEPLPAELAARLAGLRRANVGAFWTRQAFLTTYDLELNGPAEVTDPTALYFELWAKMTALPPMAGTIPEASLLPEMGGYDATYYGYLWSRIRAADMLSEFKRAGLTSPQVGLRYRRAVLEPGSTAEPEELIQSFLGRPTRPDAFYESLGLRAAGR